MEHPLHDERICQSCGMLLEDEDDYGTNKDGSKTDKFCKYCFSEGDFTNPSLTLQQMLLLTEKSMRENAIPEDEIRCILELIPNLGRWKKL